MHPTGPLGVTCVDVMRSRMIPNVMYMCLVLNGFTLSQNLRSLSADVRQLPGFAGSTGQTGALTARDLLFPDSFADAYQLDVDTSQGPALNAAYLSVSCSSHYGIVLRPLLPTL